MITYHLSFGAAERSRVQAPIPRMLPIIQRSGAKLEQAYEASYKYIELRRSGAESVQAFIPRDGILSLRLYARWVYSLALGNGFYGQST